MWSIQESQPKFSERNTFIQMDTWIIIKGWQSESTFLPKGSACTKAEVGSSFTTYLEVAKQIWYLNYGNRQNCV